MAWFGEGLVAEAACNVSIDERHCLLYSVADCELTLQMILVSSSLSFTLSPPSNQETRKIYGTGSRPFPAPTVRYGVVHFQYGYTKARNAVTDDVIVAWC